MSKIKPSDIEKDFLKSVAEQMNDSRKKKDECKHEVELIFSGGGDSNPLMGCIKCGKIIIRKPVIRWAVILKDKYFSVCESKEEAEDLIAVILLAPSIKPVKFTIKKIGIIEL